MNLLALEFSSSHRSVAVLEYEKDGRTAVLSFKSDADFRKVSGMVLIDGALKEAKLRPEEVTKMAVGLGPGSYTGIRSAIAIAQGWQLARGIDLVGLSSIEVIAAGAKKQKINGEVTIIVDAQRKELYAATYNLDSERPAVMESLRLIPVCPVPAAKRLVGPDAGKFVPGATDLFPRADILGEVALLVGVATPGERLEPIYLRESSFVKAPVSRIVP